ncbi:unnamed protein product [Prunus armeniaca]|uniref:Uncharacterized protein n=1 Tax=Prunus armeniaca TaxID=36596 RepID=A0A6J5Y4E7_PRUAR|nr:unnamed protein product [Prunus armeniaca]
MEKLRRKPSSWIDSFSFVHSSNSGDLFISQKGMQNKRIMVKKMMRKKNFYLLKVASLAAQLLPQVEMCFFLSRQACPVVRALM